LYGHNWSALLGSLPKIKPGDKIKIILSNGQEKNFVVKYTSIVAPSDTKILSDSADSRITLYTCAGFLDSKRFVATALLKN
jgi:LPXTG-site transpeptidase (sortase) family protein